jgi:hypothetical protein
MPVKLFISYAHRDEDMRKELDDHLSLLQRQGHIESWHDRAIEAGQQWADEIAEALNEAQVILLLVSARFLASDYIQQKEITRALERHAAGEAVVIPIILSACDWQTASFSKLQALPKDAKPIKSWNDRDEAWTDVASKLRRVIERLSAQPPKLAPPASATGNVSVTGNMEGSVIVTGNNNVVGSNPPTQPAPAAPAPRGELSFSSKQRIVNALLACACMQTTAARNQVIAELPDALGNRIQRHDANKQDVLSIVSTCLDFETGMSSLLEIVEFHDGGTQAWVQLQATLADVLPQ